MSSYQEGQIIEKESLKGKRMNNSHENIIKKLAKK